MKTGPAPERVLILEEQQGQQRLSQRGTGKGQ